ncbi:hypothetical protein ACFLVK_01460 [Chloroflexota bacterium]
MRKDIKQYYKAMAKIALKRKIVSMLNIIKELVLTKNDKCMDRFAGWIGKTFHISISPTQSRWGFVGILLSWALFFAAFSAAVVAIYLSYEMWWILGLTIWFGILGFFILVLTVSLFIYFARNPKDTSVQDINQIINNTYYIPKMCDSLEEIGNLLKEIKDKIGGK